MLLAQRTMQSIIERDGAITRASTEHVLIDDVLPDRLTVERAEDIAGGLLAHPVHRLARDAGHVRRHDDVRKFEQRMADRRRLHFEYVETCAGKFARHQRVM